MGLSTTIILLCVQQMARIFSPSWSRAHSKAIDKTKTSENLANSELCLETLSHDSTAR